LAQVIVSVRPARSKLIERDLELVALGDALRRLQASHGSVLVIEGSAGMGKSRLIQALAERASGAGAVIALTRAVELDASLPLAVVSRLLLGPLRACADRRARDAIAALTTTTASSSVPLAEGATAVLYALAEGVEALADAGPLVVAVDDVHWADRASARWLAQLAERALELPVLLAVAHRPDELDPELAARFRVAPGAAVLAPRELSVAGVAALVARRLPHAHTAVAAVCRRVTGGNPFLVSELLAAVDDNRISAAQLEALTPRTVRDGVLVRLARLPAGALELARATAVLGDGARLHHAAQLAGLDPRVVAQPADALLAADILVGRDPLAFRHPLLAAAVRDELGPFERSRMHRDAAELLAADGEYERAGAHLLEVSAAGDPSVVRLLRDAAARAGGRGDANTARRLLERALDEPPAPELRPEVLMELAVAEAALGEPAALAHADAAVAGIDDDVNAASFLRRVARIHHARCDYATAAAVAARALERAGRDAPNHEQLQATWMLSSGLNPGTVDANKAAVNALVMAFLAGREPEEPALLALIAIALTLANADPAEAMRLATAAIEGELATDEDGLGHGLDYALSVFLRCGHHRRLETMAAAVLDWAAARGSLTMTAGAAVWRAPGRLRLGDLDGAAADAETALRPLRHGWNVNGPQAYATLAEVCLERGDLAGAHEAIQAGAAIQMTHPHFVMTTGLVRQAHGDAEGALVELRRAGEMLESTWGITNPNVLPWHPAAALAALQAGRRAEAEALAAAGVDLAADTRVPAVQGLAMRAYALVTGQIERLRDAHALLQDTDDQLEAVRTRVELGSALRRAGSRAHARAELAVARDEAERLDLPALAARAEEEQRASGARPRRARRTGLAALTPSELRIARRATGGASNRQIAAELYLTPKTVEWHMGNVFRKLDVGSRAELATSLATETPRPS
jgi:DNA-binding CsgD family transcriptional regulator